MVNGICAGRTNREITSFSNISFNTLKNFSRESDTGDKYKIANISANFRKNSDWPQWHTKGPGVN
jgi:hypothetical protein